MKDLLLILLDLAVMTAKLCGPGGVRAVVAENLLLKQQLTVLRRGRRRAPRLRMSDRFICGFGSLFLSPGRIRKVAVAFRPSTLLAFHQALVRRKYRRLFSSTPSRRKPGPKGPDADLIQAVVELKSRNPRFGCPRIARIISQTFGIDIDRNVVYRVLAPSTLRARRWVVHVATRRHVGSADVRICQPAQPIGRGAAFQIAARDVPIGRQLIFW